MAEDDDDDSDEGTSGGGISKEVVASYVAFAKRAISRRKLTALAVFIVGASIAIAVGSWWPRTYHCETRLIAQQNQVLSSRGDSVNDALRGAPDLVLRRDNVEEIVKKTDLVATMKARRPFILRVKDAIMDKLRGPVNPKDAFDGAVWTVSDKLTVTVVLADATLTLAIDWPDPQSASKILQIASDNFLQARHVAEISTISEYVSILEDHASTIRTEVDQIAAQVKDLRTAQRKKLLEQRRNARLGGAEDALPADGPRRVMLRPRTPEADEELPQLKAALDAKQREVSQLEEDRSRRLVELQAKLTELQAQYTSAHPAIVDLEQNILAVSHESPQVTALRSDVSNLEGDIKRRTGTSATASGYAQFSGEFGATAGAAPLPADIMDLMQDTDDDLDPAISAQLRYAVEKYTNLRSLISNTRIELDTAQAAFNHRYKTVVPPEVPTKPIKPKVPVIFAVGLIGALLFSLLVPILAELSSGRIVERWQVEQLALPVLAELRFPPRSTD